MCGKMLAAALLASTYLLASAPASASPLSASTVGLASAATTITFDEHVLPTGASVTDQYADLGVTFAPFLVYSPQSGFPNISGNGLSNYRIDGNVPDPALFSMLFGAAQSSVSFAMVSNGTSFLFEALLDNILVEHFSANVGFEGSNFYGFTGLAFDQIRVSMAAGESFIMDNLSLSNGPAALPEPCAPALFGVALAGLAWIRRSSRQGGRLRGAVPVPAQGGLTMMTTSTSIFGR